MRDRRSPWLAQLAYVAGDRISKKITVRSTLKQSVTQFHRLPAEQEGRQIIMTLTLEEAKALIQGLEHVVRCAENGSNDEYFPSLKKDVQL